MKIRLFIAAAALMLTALYLEAETSRMSRSEYIARYKDTAIKQMMETGIPASITLAQGCLESGDGNSRLAVEGNNHFGIKCHGWKGKTIHEDDDAKGECFRKYSDAEESYRDHGDFLRYSRRYASLFDLDRTDYKGWAYGLKAAGYATAPDYAKRLIKIIEENNLARYDILTETQAEEIPPTPTQSAASFVLKPTSDSPLFRISLDREVREQNGVAFIVANGKDSFRSLAKEYNLFNRELMRFNDIKRNCDIPAGTVVYLEKKKKESARYLDKHVVEEGETMHSISQKYAIQLKYLYTYNNMSQGQEPEPGEMIYLKARK